MTQRTVPKHRFKMLVDYLTEQIVWLSYLPGIVPPIIDPSLNFKNFLGHTNIDVYKEYENFKLFYVPNNKSLIIKDKPFETKQEEERIQLLRYKCQTFDLLNGLFATYSERIDLPNAFYLDTVNGPLKDEWVSIYENIYNCSKENAVKLLDFKISEYQKSNFVIKSTKLQVVENLKNAKTIDDLKFIYNTTNIKLFNVDPMLIFSQ